MLIVKLLKKFILIPISAIAISSAVYASQHSTNPHDYKLIALNDCKVVSESTLTKEQLDAYLSLKEEELLMSELENPITDMESEIKEFTDRIEEITSLAVQETDDAIHIDKRYLKEQGSIAHELGTFISLHLIDTDAIEELAERIGKQVLVFEVAIESGLENLEYDQIRVITPDNRDEHYSCDKSNPTKIM